MTRLKVSLIIETGSKADASVDPTEGMAVLREAHAQAKDPSVAPDVAARRGAWLGGAVRMFAVLTGRFAEKVLEDLGPAPAAPPAAPVAARYADVVAAATPTSVS